MRPSHVATAVVAFTAGLTAAAAVRARADRRPALLAAPVPLAVPSEVEGDAVVLPFARPLALAAPEQPAAPARCGDTGGTTKAGAPCAARANDSGRCHHHALAA